MIDRLRLALGRIGLPAWFIAIDLLWIAKPDALAIDAFHYQRATDAWLAGGDPYAVTVGGIPYLAGPHTLLFYAPTSLLPSGLSAALWMGLGIAATAWTIRRLGLPLWWMLFPPALHAMWNGNPQSIALALLLVGGSFAAAAGVALKLYTGLALVFRPRAIVASAVLLLVTLPIVPWQEYLQQGQAISGHLQTAWNGSAWRLPVLIPFVVAALWVLRRKGAEWFVVPALFPATQFYYVAMALPALVGRPVVAALFALPMVLMTPLVVIALAIIVVLDERAPRWRARLPWPSVADAGDGRALDESAAGLGKDVGWDGPDRPRREYV